MASLEQVGAKLVALRVVTEDQWRQASDGTSKLVVTLDRLLHTPGTWYDPNNPEAQGLTDFQRKAILSGNLNGQLDRLDRRLRLGKFLLLRQLGQGGMGIVWMAWDLEKHRYVALKRVQGDSSAKRARFRREARICGRLHHASICRALGFRQSGKAALLVMEYLAGRTLKAEVNARGETIPWPDVARWAADLLDGLAYAHGRGVIHRDVKPENVMLTPAGRIRRAKLLDMGLAKCKLDPALAGEVAENLTVAGQIIGTPAYMSPEQWQGGSELGPESDIYALGGTIYYALAGRPPFRGDSVIQYCNAHVQQKPIPVRDIRSDIPERLDGLVLKMLAKHPRQRGSAVELLWEVRQLLATLQSAPQESEQAASQETTPEVSGLTPQPPDETIQPTPTPPAAPASEAVILFSEGPDQEQTQPLRFTRSTKIWLHSQVLARLLPASGAWSLYPAGPDPAVWHNDEPVRGRRRLAVGDRVRLETREWVVEMINPPAPPRVIISGPTFEVRLNDQLLAEADVGNETLIGESEECDVQLPAGMGLAATWAVIARTDRGWELHSLTGRPFTRNGAELGTSIVFRGADEVEQDGVRFLFKPASDAPPMEAPASRGSDPSLYLEPEEAGPLGPTAIRETTFYLRCAEVCSKVTAALKEAGPNEPREAPAPQWLLKLRRFWQRWRRPKDPAEELSRLEAALNRAPDDHESVHDLAQFFDRYGFDNLYGALLMELFRKEPRNVPLLLELADVYARRARQSDRPHFERVQSATEAFTCLTQAQKLRPGADISSRVRQAAAEMMLLKSGFNRK
jgi:eukaryotic-like serine/threonine-protein kinase